MHCPIGCIIECSSYVTQGFYFLSFIFKIADLQNQKNSINIKFPSSVTRFFYFYFFILKFPSYLKLVMASLLNLTPFYDVIIPNLVF